ncbi:MAG: hypothetical protein ACRDLF_08400 [Solirubrobacteraceae bacterium]
MSCAALLALAAGAVSAAPAAAWEEELTAPEYSISVVEGVTTQPEEPILYTSGSVRVPNTHHVQVTLRIVHNGVTVAQDTETNGNAGFSQVPQVGDTVYLESPTGSVVGSIVYDGLPTLDPTVCAGSTNLSGQRSANEEIEGSYYTLVPHPSYTARRPGEEAQVSSLSGPSFAGDFLTAPALGQTLRVVEHLKTALAGGATFTYRSENDRPVGACPVPPAPPPPPPVPALQGSIFKLIHTTILKLLKSGWLDQVTINQPGTVTQDLYQLGGTVPAYASAHESRHRHKHRPPAVLLARGSASAAGAGKVNVMIRVTAKGRRALRHSHRMRAKLITTLKSTSGAKLNLETRTVTLDR